jgi:hypothetical protein
MFIMLVYCVYSDRWVWRMMIQMKIMKDEIVSNSDVTKNYKACREIAEKWGKVFVFKNNEPDAVLFSINKYAKLSALIEFAEHLSENDIEKILDYIPKEGVIINHALGMIRKDLDQIVAVDVIE